MAEPRKLRGHKATASCCVASRDRSGLVVTSGEDGSICWFDMRCKDVQLIMGVGEEPISSLCFKTGNEDILYACSGNAVKSYDVHMLDAASWKTLESYSYNSDEINQISCNPKSSFLASADDSGDVKIIDIINKRLYKTLRNGHTSICSTVQFIPWRPWEVITGGLDSKLILWDFSKGRPQKIINFGLPDINARNSTGQCLNPAFVHSIAIPEADMLEKIDKICVVGRGDGVLDLINIEAELPDLKSKNLKQSRKGTQSSSSKRSNQTPDSEASDQTAKKRVLLDYSLGGHSAAISCVAFSLFGERGKFIISGGNDKKVKVWDCSRCLDAGEAGKDSDFLRLNIDLTKKVNWLCTTPADSENLIVCDTTKVVKVYSLPK